MCLESTKKIIERLIQVSALVFIDNEETIICDSTWLSHSQYGGGYEVVHDKENAPLDKCTKMHIACLKNSKIIAFAKSTKGTVNDCPIFKELVVSVMRNGFNIRSVLADAGYLSKDNYALCRNFNIENTFIDFKSNSKLQGNSKSLWAQQLKVFLKDNDLWHEKYRFRVIVEGIFSAMKKKQVTYLRSRNQTSRENELLIKALVYNLTVIGRYF
jgi:transposase